MGVSHHCDLCGEVIKDTYWLLLSSQCFPGSHKPIYNLQDIVDAAKESQTGKCDDYTICEDCKLLLNRTFTYKKEKIGEIIDFIDRIYKLPSEEK